MKMSSLWPFERKKANPGKVKYVTGRLFPSALAVGLLALLYNGAETSSCKILHTSRARTGLHSWSLAGVSGFIGVAMCVDPQVTRADAAWPVCV